MRKVNPVVGAWVAAVFSLTGCVGSNSPSKDSAALQGWTQRALRDERFLERAIKRKNPIARPVTGHFSTLDFHGAAVRNPNGSVFVFAHSNAQPQGIHDRYSTGLPVYDEEGRLYERGILPPGVTSFFLDPHGLGTYGLERVDFSQITWEQGQTQSPTQSPSR